MLVAAQRTARRMARDHLEGQVLVARLGDFPVMDSDPDYIVRDGEVLT